MDATSVDLARLIAIVAEEVMASGFELVQVVEDWPGRWPLASYCAVFSKPQDKR